jgi:hypothetical protein
MAPRRKTRHTGGHMNDLLFPTNLLTLSADSGTLALALFFGVLTAVFTLRMERRREK